MLKKFFIAMMAIAVMGFGFVACSDDDDEETPQSDITTEENKDEDEDSYASYYGTYTGTVMNQASTIIVKADSVDQGGNYGAYTKVLWLKNDDSKPVVAAQSDKTNEKNGNLTTENYTTAASCYIVFNTDGTATYFVPAMATMMPNGATFTKSTE